MNVVGDREYDRAQPFQEADLTLGPVMLLGIFFVLALICAGFFGWGYVVGHRGSQDESTVMKPAPDAPAYSQAGCPQSKPSASSQMEVAPDAENDGGDLAANLAASEDSGQPAGAGASSSQGQVRPALPPAANPPQQASGTAAGLNGGSAVLPAGAFMIQIAAVSQPEDADVLVSALRKRGYEVTARRESADGLVHVRIGPFTSRDEANRWRQKLTSDGYNAVVQQ